MNITENMIGLWGLLIIALSLVVLLPFKVKNKKSWILYFPAVPFTLYVIYESIMLTQFSHINIRVDLLVIIPLLGAVAARTWSRASKVWHPTPLIADESVVSPDAVPTSGVAICSLVAGIVGVLLPALGLPALVAVICGHVALAHAKSAIAFKGKKIAIAGLVLGYAGLLFNIWLWFLN